MTTRCLSSGSDLSFRLTAYHPAQELSFTSQWPGKAAATWTLWLFHLWAFGALLIFYFPVQIKIVLNCCDILSVISEQRETWGRSRELRVWILALLLRLLLTVWLISVTWHGWAPWWCRGVGRGRSQSTAFCELIATKQPGVYRCHPHSLDPALMSAFKQSFLWFWRPTRKATMVVP